MCYKLTLNECLSLQKMILMLHVLDSACSFIMQLICTDVNYKHSSLCMYIRVCKNLI